MEVLTLQHRQWSLQRLFRLFLFCLFLGGCGFFISGFPVKKAFAELEYPDELSVSEAPQENEKTEAPTESELSESEQSQTQPIEAFSQENLLAAKEKIAHTQTEMNETLTAKKTQEKTLKDSQQSLKAINAAVETTNTNIQKQKQEHEQTKAKIAEAQTAFNELYQRLLGQIRQAYQIGRWNQVKLIFNQNNIQEAEHYSTLQQYFHKASLYQLEKLSTLEKNLLALEAALQNETKELSQLQETQQRQQTEQTRIAIAHKARLESLNHTLAKMQHAMKTLQQEESKIDAELKKAAQLAKLRRSFTAQKGKLLWPVEKNPQEIDTNEVNPQGKGILIEAAPNTRIKAVHEGKVVFANWLRGFGQMIIIDHGEGFLSLYGQNEVLLKKQGEWVLTGETIATLGSNSQATLSGLYFEIRQNGQAKNPLNWIAKR